MLRVLIRKQLLELFKSFIINPKTGRRRSGWGLLSFVALLMALFAGLGVLFLNTTIGLGSVMVELGLDWLLLSVMALVAMTMGLFGSVFNTFSSLYLPKDNEFLMSLPISSLKLLFARFIGVYVMSLLYSAWVWIPAVIGYWTLVPLSAASVLCPILMTFVIALVVSVLSCVLGWVVAKIASKAKGHSLVTMVVSLTGIALYYVIYFWAVEKLENLGQNAGEVASFMQQWFRYVSLMGRAAQGDFGAFATVVAVGVALTAVCLWVLSRNYGKLVLQNAHVGRTASKSYTFASTDSGTALLKREFVRFGANPTWMLNCALGLILMPAGAIFALVKAADVRAFMAEAPADAPVMTVLPVVVAGFICMLVSTDDIAAPSVSLEGKNLWIVQTLPVDMREVLLAKERMAVLLNVAAIMPTTIILGIVFGIPANQIVMMLAFVILFACVMTDAALILDISHLNLNWTEEVAVIKSGVSVAVALFGGWILSAAIVAVGIFASPRLGTEMTLDIMIAVLVVVSLAMKHWLMPRAAKALSYAG